MAGHRSLKSCRATRSFPQCASSPHHCFLLPVGLAPPLPSCFSALLVLPKVQHSHQPQCSIMTSQPNDQLEHPSVENVANTPPPRPFPGSRILCRRLCHSGWGACALVPLGQASAPGLNNSGKGGWRVHCMF